MKFDLEPGTYVIAVSGGVDSIALLHALMTNHQLAGYKFIVAHLDHGIRADSTEDRQLVQRYAVQYKLPFVYEEAKLGPGTSEDEARHVRYDFLHKVRDASGATAIITAHHQDDVLETAVHNVFRGTGRKGLSSLRDTIRLKRPLLHITKTELKSYAQANGLVWREDSTNADLAYTRNYIRHRVLSKLSTEQKQQLLSHLKRARALNQEIDQLLALQLHVQPAVNQLDRSWFIILPHVVAREAMAAWLRNNALRGFDKKFLERLVIGAKTLPAGKFISVNQTFSIHVQPTKLALIERDR